MTDKGRSQLESRLRAVWHRERFLHIAAGLLALCRWGLALFLAGVLIDWLIKLPSAGRAVVLLIILGGACFKAWRAGWRHMRHFEAAHTALQVEREKGGMASLLVTAVQLRESAATDALVQVACGEAEEAAGSIQARETVPFGALRRPATWAGAVVALLIVLSLTQGGLLLAGLGRMLTPWAAINYPTRTQLVLTENELVVKEGDPVSIVARVTGVVPTKAKLSLRTGTSRPRVRRLPIKEGQFEYAIETAHRSFEYRLAAGDARTDWHRVEVIHAPHIDRADVTLTYPEYTLRPAETVDALTLTVPETTRVRWVLTLDRAVREASMTLSGRDPLPMDISEDGLTVSLERVASESLAYGFAWVERDHGFAFGSLSHYLQVAPDRPPRVELTAPTRNIYATLGRKVELAFRGRDDHGIGESVVAYRIDKTEEARTAFSPVVPIDGTEQVIDWDYRNVLTNLAIGQTVTFAVELADRYPGPEGPHRVRSEARWIQFMSREKYLAEVEKEKRRLLAQLKALYREEREVHTLVMRLEPADPVFVQNCQLEAVRQGLMRERVNTLATRMQELTHDLAANNITNHPIGNAVSDLRVEVVRISDEHLAAAAPALRALAGRARGEAAALAAAKAEAADAVNDTARELGLLVLELGYEEAADVMARELHAAAATQAALRLRTIVQQEDADSLAAAQERLAAWLKRLFAASPRDRESTIEEALTAFTLSRTVGQLVTGGLNAQFAQAAASTRAGRADEASRVQTDIVQALLKAEFRLGVGAERNALATAQTLLEGLAEDQAALRAAITDGEPGPDERTTFATTQEALHRRLQLLLMPQVPARRARFDDTCFPSPPPVMDLLSAADEANKQAVVAIRKGDFAAVRAAQQQATTSFSELAAIAKARIAVITQLDRIDRVRFVSEEIDSRLERYAERQIGLLEKTEDAVAEEADATYLVDRQAALADAVQRHGHELQLVIDEAAIPTEHALAVPACLGAAAAALQQAAGRLEANKPGEAVVHQEAAIAAIAVARELLTEHGGRLGPYTGAIGAYARVKLPSPLITEIIDAQRDMQKLTGEMKAEELPSLALDQKNLIHAVDAILGALAVASDSSLVMMFAKEDMYSAALALEDRDRDEALDAQAYIVETMEDLRGKIEAMIPRYHYILEITEAIHEEAHAGVQVREAQRRLRATVVNGGEGGTLAEAQAKVTAAAEQHGDRINRIAGRDLLGGALAAMREAEASLKADGAAAGEAMAEAETLLRSDAAAMSGCMSKLGLVASGGEPYPPHEAQVALLNEVLTLAVTQRVFFREQCTADGEALRGVEARLHDFEKALGPFIAEAKTHKVPAKASKDGEPEEPVPPANLHLKLVDARKHFAQAAAGAKAGDRERTFAAQDKAGEALRHFVIDYAIRFLRSGGSAPPPPPAPNDILKEKQDEFDLFMPGAVTGQRPPDGRAEWEVLGKRERAALNENFARELPLEHRAILKNYYERLAR